MLTNVKVSYRGFDAYDAEPGAQPDVFAERPIVVFGKWHGPRTVRLKSPAAPRPGLFTGLRCERQCIPRRTRGSAATLGSNSHCAFIRLQLSTGRSRSSSRNYVTGFDVLTLDTIHILRSGSGTDSQSDWARQGCKSALPLPDGVSELAVGDPYASGAEPDFWILLAGIAVLMTISIAFHARKSQSRKLQC